MKISERSQLNQLKGLTTVVADTGDFDGIRAFEPQDSTTNPTLIYTAVQQDKYYPILEEAAKECANNGLHKGKGLIEDVIDHLLVGFGVKILEIIPGRVSTEVNARLSYDTEGTIEKARKIIALYEKKGISRDRVLIKIASTWEGIEAAKVLEKEGIRCNMTLLFSLAQAIACAEVGATLISPFVGRILDWYKEKTGESYSSEEDPGVQSVKTIYNYYKKYGYKTEVMGASFRNIGEITELAGCDLLTISPKLLKILGETEGKLEPKLDIEKAKASNIQKLEIDEKEFRWHMGMDPMATEKLCEGIRRFHEDTVKLAQLVENELLDD